MKTLIIEEIRKRALLTGEFTLRSGRTSHYYIDKYKLSSYPKTLEAIAQGFQNSLEKENDVSFLAGTELGGIPLVTALSLKSGIPAIFIRNSKKDYGTKKMFEGPDDFKNDNGTGKKSVVLVEDVCTTGGQIIEAAILLQNLGLSIKKIICVIDREEGARQNIEDRGFVFESLVTTSDLGVGSSS